MMKNEPEILRGLGVNWSNYTPPGGAGWQESLHEKLLPGVQEAIDSYEKARKDLSWTIVRMDTASADLRLVGRLLAPLAADIDEFGSSVLQRIVEKQLGVASGEREPDSGAVAWLKGANENIEKLLSWNKKAHDWKREMDVIDADVTYLKAVRAFFTKDRELDAVLYGMHEVEIKYRTRIFRYAYKLFRETMDALQTIENSKSDIKGVVGKLFDEPMKELKEAYVSMPTFMKYCKKGIEKEGISFWNTFEKPSNFHTVDRHGTLVKVNFQSLPWAENFDSVMHSIGVR